MTDRIPDPPPRLTFGYDITCHICRGTGIRRSAMSRDEKRARGRILATYRKLHQLPPKLDRTCGHCNGTGFERWKA